ncbi:uncharacterized protein LOC130744865 [Lotus japonicus]|uniref:uncharacterized protein LOC130744865 n=1 Tax=Lotus japonicus TaxID=34305 RepID=UPI00258A41A7|nr:uncharacterized protein LOC130744865 [Lotus japonicus]
MTYRGFALCLVMVMVATMWTQNAAQSGCTSALTSLSPCLNYITGSSSSPSPSAARSSQVLFNLHRSASAPSLMVELGMDKQLLQLLQWALSSWFSSDSSAESPQGSMTPSASNFPSAFRDLSAEILFIALVANLP